MRTIIFKKQMLGKWRRDDGEAKTLVNEESMNREIRKLILDGWDYAPHGMIHENTYHARSYTLTK